MDYKRLEIAKKKFDIGQKLGYYNIVDLWIAVNEIFDALLDPPEADGSIDRATDGRITAEPGWKEGDSYFGASTPNSLGAQRRMKERVVNNIEQERSPNYLPEKILADGCDPKPKVSLDFETRINVPLRGDPADDGPEVGILRGRVK